MFVLLKLVTCELFLTFDKDISYNFISQYTSYS